MKWNEIVEGVGRITKQNQTVDVGPDEIKKQAKKFGNSVDKDGRPPTLSKKVKGSKTNVLFNLGLAENCVYEERFTEMELAVMEGGHSIDDLEERKLKSKAYKKSLNALKHAGRRPKKKLRTKFNEGFKLQLERDDDMYVLHITDTASGKRTEVRGKSGYESGNHDPNDKLHQLLDKVGKSANISELINGEVVTINPKHPDADRAKAATDKAYSENFADGKKNEGAEITMWTNPEYQGADVDDKYYKKQPVKIVDVSKLTPFEPADKMDPKDNHDNMMKFVDKIKAGEKIKPIVVVPHEGKLLIVDGHHRYFAHLKAGADKIRAVLADPKDLTWRDDVPESVEENFADGKKKGKSRPGRVKRSGASCNGSVTSLRKRAKNSSGEKARMYHWCANMKSGRKKNK